MSDRWPDESSTKLGAFRVARDPNPAPAPVKAAIAKAAKRAERETAAIKAKRRPARAKSR